MKALSMKQPVPELILQGKKTVELRNWNTQFRGEFFLHASLNELKGFDLDPRKLSHGALVGAVNLVNVIQFNSFEQFKSMQNKHLARDPNWFKEGKTFGFILENPYRLGKPIPMKGQLNFFETSLASPHSREKQNKLLEVQK